MENKFNAVKNVQYPNEYHCVSLARTMQPFNQGIVLALGEAIGLEKEYERLTRELKGNTDLEKVNKLVAVEDKLFNAYYNLIPLIPYLFPITSQKDLENKAREWIKHTSLLAKERTKPAERQR